MYGLFSAAVAYALYIVGLDFYMHTSREIIKVPNELRGRILKNHIMLCGLLYIIFGPIFLVLFYKEYIPWYLVSWFYLLLFLEHANQEIGRLLIVMLRPLSASLVLFVRSGLWAIMAAFAMTYFDLQRDLNVVLVFWTVSGVIALAIGIRVIGTQKMGGWNLPIDWLWIKSGVKVVIPFLLATLSLRAIYTADRYWFEFLNGLEILGVYILFVGISNALISFLDASIFSFLYPNLLHACHHKKWFEFDRILYKMALQTSLITVIYIFFAWGSTPYIIEWVGKDFYFESIEILIWLLLGSAMFSISMVPHFALYAKGHDIHIIVSHIFGLLVFISVALFFSDYSKLLAVPYAFFAAFFLVLFWKTAIYIWLNKRFLQEY